MAFIRSFLMAFSKIQSRGRRQVMAQGTIIYPDLSASVK
jgi:hypothetical protein